MRMEAYDFGNTAFGVTQLREYDHDGAFTVDPESMSNIEV